MCMKLEKRQCKVYNGIKIVFNKKKTTTTNKKVVVNVHKHFELFKLNCNE